jgi:hypothetical protein
MFKTRKYKPADLVSIAVNLRDSDREYINTVSGMSPYVALSSSFLRADKVLTVVDEEQTPVAVFAIKQGNVWLQTTKLTDGRARDVIRAGKQIVERFGDEQLFCVVPAADKRVLLLCRALGFTKMTAASDVFMGSKIPHIELTRRKNCPN